LTCSRKDGICPKLNMESTTMPFVGLAALTWSDSYSSKITATKLIDKKLGFFFFRNTL